MSLEAVGRHEAIRLVDDLDVTFPGEREAVGHTIVHDAEEEGDTLAGGDGRLVVVLGDGRELQGHDGLEAALHVLGLAHLDLTHRVVHMIQRQDDVVNSV